MSAQTSYSLKMSYGVAGGFVDLSVHTVDTRHNEADDDKVLFGLGVVDGTTAGKQVTIPTSASKKENFEGVVVNSHAHEQDRKGKVALANGETVGVLKEGRIFVRIAEDAEPKYGDPVYLITDGDEAGYFTNDNSSVTAIKVNGYFLDEKATDAIAPAYIKVDKLADTTESE